MQIVRQSGDSEWCHARLSGAEEFPWTTKLQVSFGDPESIICFRDGIHAGQSVIRHWICHQHTESLMISATNASSELMQLGKPESIRLFNDDRGGIWNVDPDLDDRRGDQHVYVAISKTIHDLIALVRIQSAMHHLLSLIHI